MENMTGAMDTAEEGNGERVVDDHQSSFKKQRRRGRRCIGVGGNVATEISAGRTAGPKSQRSTELAGQSARQGRVLEKRSSRSVSEVRGIWRSQRALGTGSRSWNGPWRRLPPVSKGHDVDDVAPRSRVGCPVRFIVE